MISGAAPRAATLSSIAGLCSMDPCDYGRAWCALDDGFEGVPDDGFEGVPDDGFQGVPDDGCRGVPDDGFRGVPDDGFRGAISKEFKWDKGAI